ncbi:MAG: Oligopeptide transport system permease protein OppB [Polyangiaceae bacterium]|nr:Oligopeptide transport system permease protein OppB [Polyangiaceae bacterium]
MIRARAGRLTFRRVFPRLVRLLLTLAAVVVVGFYGAANAAKRPGSGWAFRALPVFLNLAPQDVRGRALTAMRAVARDDARDAERGRRELVRLGGAALPHVLPQLDTLEPSARGRVAYALAPLALRMRVASPEDVSTPERALLFFGRFWQDRSIDFRSTTVRRAVERLAERSLTLRRDDVIHADTYALEALITALGKVRTEADVARVGRLNSVLVHVTGRGEALPRAPSVPQAQRAVEGWQRLWLVEGADYTVLEGPRRVAALVTETQFGKWLAQTRLWQLGRSQSGADVASLVTGAVPRSAIHVLLLLGIALAAAAASTLADRGRGLLSRARARLSATAASLVASYPMVLSLALAFELLTGRGGVLELCASALRRGDVNLLMGSLLAVTLLSELLVTLPARVAAAGHASDESDGEDES